MAAIGAANNPSISDSTSRDIVTPLSVIAASV
jgi:hypothetical protein